MDREAMAKLLKQVDRSCYKGLLPDESIDAAFAASPVGNLAYLAMADAALAECAKAAEEGYHEGCRDNAGDFGDPDWNGSATRAKWGK